MLKVIREVNVVILGLGVSGASFGKASTYSNMGPRVFIEKYDRPAMVNSHPRNNAQTRHKGPLETNYNLAEAKVTTWGSSLIDGYVDQINDPLLSRKLNQMVLGVGRDEIDMLYRRYLEFKHDYPNLQFVSSKELAELEPMVMKGRNPQEEVCAIVDDDGRMVNYQELAIHMIKDSQEDKDASIMTETLVTSISLVSDGYIVETNRGAIRAKVVVCEAGPFSLLYAHELGYGKDLAILSVAGSFFTTPRFVNGKVYRPQDPIRPMAEIHIDVDITDPEISRLGPTTKPVPLTERHQYGTMIPFLRSGIVCPRGALSLINILRQKGNAGYLLRNVLYDNPIAPEFGKSLFLEKAKVIIPTMQLGDLHLRKGAGGIRPQIVDLEKMAFSHGDSNIVGDNILFNTTPSPGATISMANAVRDVEQVISFLGRGYYFDRKRLLADLGITDNPNYFRARKAA